MIDFNIENSEVPGFNSELFVLWLEKVIATEGFVCGDIAVVFCGDEYLLKINQDFLQHDFYTDIITFDYSENGVISGDLFVSTDRVKENAAAFKVSYSEELKRVCVHGVLHLCGLKDKSTEEIKSMRSREEFYLKQFVSRET